jgi:hypothetical protein
MDLLVQPTGNPADPYGCLGATFRGRPTEQNHCRRIQSGTSGAGGTKFSLGGTERTHKDLLVQPTGDQRTHMGRRVQTTGTSADPHGPLVQPTGTIAEAIWIRSGPIWVRWCNLPGPSGLIWVRWCNLLGPQRTHMGPLVQLTGTPADLSLCEYWLKKWTN